MRTENLDLVLSQLTAPECKEATDELARHLDARMTTTRELMAAFLNDLNNERLTRWGPRGEGGEGGEADGLPASPEPADSQPSVARDHVAACHTGDPGDLAHLPDSCRC